MRVLADLGEGLDGLIIELNLLEVLDNAGRSDGLGDDGVAGEQAPGEENLSGGDGLALGSGQAGSDGLDVLVDDQQGGADGVVTEARVGSDDDALGLAEVDELGAGETGVALDLVGGGSDAGVGDDGLELLNGEVGDTDSAGLGLGELSHGCI